MATDGGAMAKNHETLHEPLWEPALVADGITINHAAEPAEDTPGADTGHASKDDLTSFYTWLLIHGDLSRADVDVLRSSIRGRAQLLLLWTGFSDGATFSAPEGWVPETNPN